MIPPGPPLKLKNLVDIYGCELIEAGDVKEIFLILRGVRGDDSIRVVRKQRFCTALQIFIKKVKKF